MMAFAIADHANLRRWTISGAVVVLVHGAIAAAVVTWRNIIVPWQQPGPVVIDLAPVPPAPAEQAALAPAPAQVPPTVSADKPLDKVEEKTGVPLTTVTRLARELAVQAPSIAIAGGAALAQTNGVTTAQKQERTSCPDGGAD